MEQREFFIPLPDNAMLRVRYVKSRGRILRFASVYKAFQGLGDFQAELGRLSKVPSSNGADPGLSLIHI